MKTITYFYCVEDINSSEITDILQYSGRNTGNLLFRQALQECFIQNDQYNILKLPVSKNLFVDLDNDTCRMILESDLVLYPVANMVRSKLEFEKNPNLISETEFLLNVMKCFTCPVLCWGLGAQSHNHLQTFDLHESQIAMLKVMDMKGPICVRGSYTKEICEKYCCNVLAMGCPSLMINSNYRKGIIYQQHIESFLESKSDIKQILFCLPNNPKTGIMDLMMSFAMRDSRIHIIMQDESDIIVCRKLPSERKHIFSNINTWVDFCKNFDLCISARIHGSLIAMDANIPTILIYTDSRIYELANSMHFLNNVSADFANKLFPLDQKNDFIRSILNLFDGSGYDYNRASIATKYIDLISNLGFAPSNNLLTISQCNPSLVQQKTSQQNNLINIDIDDYCKRYPDPFLKTQNLFGIVYHTQITQNEFQYL